MSRAVKIVIAVVVVIVVIKYFQDPTWPSRWFAQFNSGIRH